MNGPEPVGVWDAIPAVWVGQEDGSVCMTAIAFPPPAPDSAKPSYEIRRRGRFWEVLDMNGELVCMTVYKQGAKEVVRRLRGE